jgi:hypothetical protein
MEPSVNGWLSWSFAHSGSVNNAQGENFGSTFAITSEMENLPLNHQAFLTQLNALTSAKPFTDRVRTYRRLVLGDPKGKAIPTSAVEALFQFRDAQPGGQLTSVASLLENAIIAPSYLNALLASFRDENEPITVENQGSRGPLIMGRKYVFYAPEFEFPIITRDPDTYYSMVFIHADGESKIYPSLDYQTLDYQIGRGTFRAEVDASYFAKEGSYSLMFEYFSGDRLPGGFSFNLTFQPYIIPLNDRDVFAIRAARRLNVNPDGDRETYFGVLSGKEFAKEGEESKSSSLLRVFVPGRPTEPLVSIAHGGSGKKVEYLTEFHIARLEDSLKLNLVGIMGRGETEPRNKLAPRVQFYQELGEPLHIGGGKTSLTIQADTVPAVNNKPGVGGVVFVRNPATGTHYAMIVPQLSFLIDNKGSNVRVPIANLYFVGRYGKNTLRKIVTSPDARFGDNIQRSMIAVGQIDPNINREQIVVFSKALVTTYDFMDDTTNLPVQKHYLQVDDPYASGNSSGSPLDQERANAFNLQPKKDVLNPGTDAGNDPLDKGPRQPSTETTLNAGGRRYGLIALVNARPEKGLEVLSIAHSQPRKGFEDGSGLMKDDKGNIVPGPLPFETPVTLYPSLNKSFYPNAFYRPQWVFGADGEKPAPSRANNGNETYLYRYFKEAFRKGADKEDSLRKLEFFNGKQLLGGTPPRSISSMGTSKLYFAMAQAPFLERFALRTSILAAEDGRTVATIEDAVALDVLESAYTFPLLVTWRRFSKKTLPGDKINYGDGFGLALYELRPKENDRDVVEPVYYPLDFGKEQPYLENFDEQDVFRSNPGIGVQGNEIALQLPYVNFQGKGCLLTATPSPDGTSALQYHLYASVIDEGENQAKFQKVFADILLPGPDYKIIRVTNEVDTALPQEQRASDNPFGETVFILQQEMNGIKNLAFGRLGKNANGEIQILLADLTSDNQRFA